MLNFKETSRQQTLLLLNKPQVLTENDFYTNLFKIPEVFNRLRNYRELLSKNSIDVPIWVYCLTQDITTLKGTPQTQIVYFLISMGLYDRYILKSGWPDYILGSEPLISVISNESTFENEALNLTIGRKNQKQLSLLSLKSYYNEKMKKYYLTNLKLEASSYSFKNIIQSLNKKKGGSTNFIYRFLSPHQDNLLNYMKSLNVVPRDFLEYDQDLSWLWPTWKKTQLHYSNSQNLIETNLFI